MCTSFYMKRALLAENWITSEEEKKVKLLWQNEFWQKQQSSFERVLGYDLPTLLAR